MEFRVICFALFDTLPPIEDYSYAITILNENYPKYKNVRMAIRIAFLTSTWENCMESKFVNELNNFLEYANNEQKAIIYYLNAYDDFIIYKAFPEKNILGINLTKGIYEDIKKGLDFRQNVETFRLMI